MEGGGGGGGGGGDMTSPPKQAMIENMLVGFGYI